MLTNRYTAKGVSATVLGGRYPKQSSHTKATTGRILPIAIVSFRVKDAPVEYARNLHRRIPCRPSCEACSYHHESFWDREQELSSSTLGPLSTTTSVRAVPLDKLRDEDSASWPLAGFLDFDRIGYLQHDLYPSRLFVPTVSGTASFKIAPSGSQMEAKRNNNTLAELVYWNAGWGPTRPYQLRGICGTALISCGTVYREVPSGSAQPLRSFYLWRVRTLKRDSSYGPFDEELTSEALFV